MNYFKALKYLLVDQFTFYGGGKGGGSAPSYPDPTAVANATTQTNEQTAGYNKALNLNNFSNPFGSQQTTQVGTDPNTGAPIYNTNTQATSTVSDLLGHNLAQANNSTGVQQNALNGLGGLGSYLSSLGQQAQGISNNFGGYQNGALGLSPQYQGISNNIGNVGNNLGNVSGNIYNSASGYNGLMDNVGSAASGYNGLMGGVWNASQGYNNLSNSTGALAGQYNNLNSQYANLGSQLDQGAAKNAQQQGQNAAYAAQTQYLDPQFSQQGESLGAQLANQGLTPGSQAYNNAMTNFNNTKQQAYSNAQNQAIMTGSQLGAQNLQNQISGINTQSGLLGAQGQNLGAQAGLYGQQAGMLGNQINAYGQQAGMLGNQINAYGQQAGMLGNQIGAYGQQAGVLGNQANAYGQQMNALGGQAGLYGLAGQLGQGQLGALGAGMNSAGQQAGLYGQQVGIGQLPYQNAQSVAGFIPGYSGTGQSSAAPADISGLYNNQYQSQLAGYNGSQASSNNMMSGLFGLGSAGIMGMMMSDRRAKRSIKRVGTWANGLGVYIYRYMWEPKNVRHLGFMADEVRQIAPHAVRRGADGFDRVNYQLAA